MGHVGKSLSAITCRQWYIEMATDFPLPQSNLAKSWPIIHIRTRSSFRALSAINVRKGYLEMATGGPSFHDIRAKPWPICQRNGRPSVLILIADGDFLF